MKGQTLKRTLSLTLAALVLVTSFGFTSAVYAEDADASTEQAEFQAGGVGELTAKGDGIAMLGGRGIVELNGNGILWIRDVAGDATIEVSGQGNKEEFSDGWIQYSGFHGKAYVKGSRIRVIVAGVDIDLYAKGRGRAFLWGHGSYQINGHTSRWETERLGARIKLAAPADVSPQASNSNQGR